MNQQLKEKIRESYSSVLPITVIVLLASVILTPLNVGSAAMFLVGALFLVLGMGLFTLGADIAMMPMGEGIGIQFSKSKRLLLVIVLGFVMGFIITIAEPDLQVLAYQVQSIPNQLLIISVAVGVGLFLVIAVLRILFKVRLSYLLTGLYALLFLVTLFVPQEFLAVAFDAGGVTTGPITVPFIMAMGLGLSVLRGDKSATEDSFGLVALSSIGPILAVLLLGIIHRGQETAFVPVSVPEVFTTRDVIMEFVHTLPHHALEVVRAIAPIVGAFIIFQLLTHRFRKRELLRILIGFGYTLVGLILFLTGVNEGFIAVGYLLGNDLASGTMRWLLAPIGLVIGYFIVAAEPAVHVLNKHVEDISGGSISQAAMSRALSCGVAVAVGLSMLRVLTGVSVYWILLPGYAIAIGLTFFVPKIFVGIAFDSGGVASGPMASCFLLPLAIGACEALGGNVMIDAFGSIAMVALTPLIAIQIMGLVYGRRLKQAELAERTVEDEIILFDDIDGWVEISNAEADDVAGEEETPHE